MRMASQRGILLLPVALTLAVVGMLAYTMTQEGSMNVSAVDAQYEIERARYLAASGVQLAKWRAAKDECDEDDLDFDDITAGIKFFDGSIALGKVVFTSVDMGGGNITVSLVATTERNAAVHALTRKEQVVDLTEVKYATIIGPGDADTTLVKNNPASQTGQTNSGTLTATEGAAHPLLVFKLPGDLDRASIIQADLIVTKNSGNATQSGRTLAVHRVTRNWSAGGVTWTTPWAKEGGDYVEKATDRVTIDEFGDYDGDYTWHIASLAQSWASYPASNYGVLLKPTSMANVQFVSFNGANKPELVVRYYKRCT